MKSKTIIFGLNLLLLIIVAVIGHTSVGYWVSDVSADYTDQRVINAFFEQYSQNMAYSRVNAIQPSMIKIKALTDIKHWSQSTFFIYDFGHGNPNGGRLGYESVNGFNDYRIIITWILNGYFKDNKDADTMLKFVYTAYYLLGSDEIPLKTIEYDYSTNTWNNAKIQHILVGHNAIEGQELYVKVKVSIIAQYDAKQYFDVRGENFYDGQRWMRLDFIEYQHYESSGTGGVVVG